MNYNINGPDSMNDLISVIMPAYNTEKFISESIESVLSQSYQNWELIIVDDGSTDSTAEIIKSYQKIDKRIKYLWQKNGQQGKARNYAIRESTGNYLAFIDSDDIWVNDKLKTQLRLINEQNADLIFGYSFVIENGIKTERKIGRGVGKYKDENAIGFLLFHDAFIMSTVLVKKQVIINAGTFIEDKDIQFCEDWHLWLKLAFEGNSFYTNSDVFSYYRISVASSTSVESNAQVKFFKALIDLDNRYKNNEVLENEIAKRINLLVYHSTLLDNNLAHTIFDFLDRKHMKKIPNIIFKIVFGLSVPLFRRIFLYIYSK
jgi:teichuronic acid biosynthesis glycosyltransferase TuaG